MSAIELYSPAEVGAVTGASAKFVYRAIEQRVPGSLIVRRRRQPFLTRWGAVCVLIDHEMPKDVPVTVRRQVYARIKRATRPREIRYKRGILSYVVDVRAAATKVDANLARYRKAIGLIATDPKIQAGAATFKGTRILVHHIADLLAQGAKAAELQEDYPRLTREMIAAAEIYAKAHPRRGRPRRPSWRKTTPIAERTIERRSA
jgi:uncharacterized protein (DUF433 family)